MSVEDYKHDDWIVYFSGDKWSPLGFSSWLSLYTRTPFSDNLDYFVNQAVVVWDGEATTCYIRESEREIFGKKVVEKVISDSKYVDFICERFHSATDHVLSIYNGKQKEFTYKEYADYNSYFLNYYYPYHIQVKNVDDLLPPQLLKTYLPKLEVARVHAEPVFSSEIGFMKKIAAYISEETGYKTELILHTLTEELTAYWRDGKDLPSKSVLEERSKGSVIFLANATIQDILVGKEIAKFSSIFLRNDSDVIKGQTAFGGQARGVVRIIIDPANVKEFNKGDILVAPWTRPEYLPIMKKAGAFITDGGGILSHAAIVARELKKPCVIGTQIATKVLRDGDVVEVDADRGVVTIIKKK